MFAQDDIEFIQKRCVGSMFLHDKEPVMVDKVTRAKTGKIVFRMYKLFPDQNMFEVDMDKLCFKPVPLGFLNVTNKDCVYLERIPQRAWRQGTEQGNVYSNGIDIFRNLELLRNTIVGNYPAYKDACKKKVFTAFHRDFAVNSDQKILYKNVGVVGTRDALLPRYQYLREYLDEVLN